MAYKYSNKIDALTLILRRLNNGEQLTAASLAEDFSVSSRTIFRYFSHLQAAGYPIYYDKDSKSYKFLDNYRLSQTASHQASESPFDLRAFSQVNGVAIATFRKTGECLHKNRAMARLMGCTSWKPCCSNFRDIPWWAESGLLALAEETLTAGGELHRDIRLTIDGRERWIQAHMTLVERKKDSYLVFLAQDLTPRMQREMQVARFFAAINQAPHLILVTNTEGTIEYVSERVEELTGYTSAELIGENPRVLKSDKTSPQTHQNLWDTISKGYTWSGELYNRKKDGSHYWQHLRVAPIFDRNRRICRYVGVIEDISRQKELDEELYSYAVSDLLTGLYKRKMFIELGSRELRLAQRYNHSITLLVLDIDNLKSINDLYGFKIGNQALVQVAGACRSVVRATDIIGRVGSDSFGILLTESGHDDAHGIARRIQQTLLQDSLKSDGQNVSFTVSSTIVIPSSTITIDKLLAAAERQLQTAQTARQTRQCSNYSFINGSQD